MLGHEMSLVRGSGGDFACFFVGWSFKMLYESALHGMKYLYFLIDSRIREGGDKTGSHQ